MTPVDLERLIQIIVEELAAAGAGRAPVRCACHSVLYECCPSRVAPGRRGGCDTPRTPCCRWRRRRRGGDDRPHAAEAGCDEGRDRDALPRGVGVRVRQRLREPDVGRDLRAPA